MGKKKEPKFKIGDWVKFNYEIKRFIENKIVGYNRVYKRSVERVKTEEKVGQIVGATYRFEGEIIPQSGSYSDYEAGYLNVKNSKFVWQVKIGYLNKVIEVFEDDLMILKSPFDENDNYRKLPWKDCGWTEHTKKQLSDWMKKDFKEYSENYPRDAKGRFCK